MEIDRVGEKEIQTLISKILNKAVNLVESYAVDTKENNISLYRLKSHWKDAIKRFSSTSMEWREIKKHLRPRVVTFLSQKHKELISGKLSPEPDNDVFVVVADIARLSKGLDFEKETLKLAKKFLKEYAKYKDTFQYLFLKRRITLVWINNAVTKILSKNYSKALESITEGLELEPDNARLNYLASTCYRMVGNPSKALEHCEKALESNPANIVYLDELGNVLELEGENLYEVGDFSLAIVTLGEAVQSYKKAITIIENLNPAERGAKKEKKANFDGR